ncbi:zf-HC2 domain-containing protein [Corynebacterium epidermidicanis]|uniref:Putative integral membrane protein n=1 Tax=Corynebacterium epidermidicanis TaxID=1050174 RepID=A0A0G3GV34_9CORY|nr:zf-HC2 domain-containing protein [Corynebacterium epidermidicanis]AKK02687.1 putative integral membrane protein [Corynebacterium epidermidicanis]
MLSCDQVRAALSARLDGEPSGLDDALADAHLSGCAECQAWFDQAAHLNRQLAFSSADTSDLVAPDLSANILANLGTEATSRKFVPEQLVLARVLLVVMGMVFLGWGVRHVVTAATPVPFADPAYIALLIDVAAIRMAFGYALFFAAWKPRLAGGMLPIFATVTMFSLGFGMREVFGGSVQPAQVWGWILHIVSVLVLLWAWFATLGFGRVGRSVRSLGARPVPEN